MAWAQHVPRRVLPHLPAQVGTTADCRSRHQLTFRCRFRRSTCNTGRCVPSVSNSQASPQPNSTGLWHSPQSVRRVPAHPSRWTGPVFCSTAAVSGFTGNHPTSPAIRSRTPIARITRCCVVGRQTSTGRHPRDLAPRGTTPCFGRAPHRITSPSRAATAGQPDTAKSFTGNLRAAVQHSTACLLSVARHRHSGPLDPLRSGCPRRLQDMAFPTRLATSRPGMDPAVPGSLRHGAH